MQPRTSKSETMTWSPQGTKGCPGLDYKDLAQTRAHTAMDRLGPERQNGGRETDRQTGADRQTEARETESRIQRHLETMYTQNT